MKGTTRALIHFRKVDPVLWKACVRLDMLEFKKIDARMDQHPSTKKIFEDICETIIGQQLSGKAANTIFGRFKKVCPLVTPKKVAALSLEDLRGVGISYAKGRALHDLAYKVQEKIVRLDDLEKLSDDELRHRLISVRGIGPWTAEMILMFTLLREDTFSPGDLGLQKGVQQVYGMRSLPSHAQMLRKSLAWTPYRTYAALMLWRIVDTTKAKGGERRKGVQ